MKLKRLFGILFLVTLFGCGHQDNLNSNILTLDPLKTSKITDNNVENIIDDIKIIKLESSDSSLLTVIKKVLLTKNGDFIVLDKTGILQFTEDGNFIRRIGQQGRANNEYIALENICLDKSSSTLLVLDGMNKVLCYDINSGDFMRSINLNWGDDIHGMYDIIPSEDGGFYILSCNTQTTKSDNSVNTVYRFSTNGLKIEESLPVQDFMITMFLSSQSYDNHYLVRPFDNNNTILKTSETGLVSYCNINFGDKNIPAEEIYNDYGELDMSGYFQSNYYKFPSMIQETKEHISFMCAGPDFSAISFVLNKNGQTGIQLSANDGKTQPFNAIVSDKDYMYFVMNKYSMDGLDNQADPLTRYVVKKYGILNTEENPRLVGVKFGI